MSDGVIDVHVHFGAPKDEESGCFWSKKFRKQPAYFALRLITGFFFKRINIQGIREHLLKVINGSKHTDKCVMLAFDQVYDRHGNACRDWTHLYVPNSYIADLAKESERILFGASVHPKRLDWEEELDFCLDNGAVLCKWIPSAQMINPADPNLREFYKKLAEHDLPLLCHCGPELTIPTSCELYNEYNNPKHLEQALDLGVTVIIAHCAMPFYDEEEYQDDFDEFFRLFEKAEKNNWKIYADLSAVCFPFRKDEIEVVKQKLGNLAAKRLLYGSDYPIWVSAFSFNKSPNFFAWLKFMSKTFFIKNLLDKNFKVIKGMGFDDSIFTNASELFEKIKR